jgi:hypothetical protein
MGFFTSIEIERLKTKYFDPANPVSRIAFKDPVGVSDLTWGLLTTTRTRTNGAV